MRTRVRRLIEAGVPWVSFRDHHADADRFLHDAEALAADLRRANPDVLLSVHGRLMVARRLGAGLHVGQRGASLAEAVGAGLDGPVGVSVHAPEAVRSAGDAGAAYVTLSPLFPTQTHPEAIPLGIPALRRAVEGSTLPVLALGGLTPVRGRQVRLGGAHGVAVLSGLLDAPDPTAAVAAFLNALV